MASGSPPKGAPPPYTDSPPPPGFNVSPGNPPYPTQHTVSTNYGPTYPPTPAANVVVVQPRATAIVIHDVLPNMPTIINCPSCHQNTLTRVDYKPGSKTHLCALMMCIFLLWPLCLLPYCMNSCQNATHYCSHCGAYIGTAT